MREKEKSSSRGVCLPQMFCSILFIYFSLYFFFPSFFYKSIYWKMMRLKDRGKVKNMQGISGFKNFRQNI
jgi:hypothetical protein